MPGGGRRAAYLPNQEAILSNMKPIALLLALFSALPGAYAANPPKLLPGNQFPIEAYDNFLKQIVPRWLSTDNAIIDAYVALIDRVCPCVVLAHSQGGHFAIKVAEKRAELERFAAIEHANDCRGLAAAAKDTQVADKQKRIEDALKHQYVARGTLTCEIALIQYFLLNFFYFLLRFWYLLFRLFLSMSLFFRLLYLFFSIS